MNSYKEYEKEYKLNHYTVLTKKMYEYIHNRTLEMLDAIIKVFDNNDIRYFLCGGTLRGAIVLNKYIPWDEDIDLCVLEDDYDKMIEILMNAKFDDMVVQCSYTEAGYYHGWIKIRDMNSHIYPDEPLYKYNGVLIDIYKLSKIKEADLERLIAEEHLAYLRRRYKAGGIDREEYEKRVKDNDLISRIGNENTKDNLDRPNKECYIVWSTKKIILDCDKCMPRKKYNFEGRELYSFKDAEHYLRRHYGENYMKLPEEKDRVVEINRVEWF